MGGAPPSGTPHAIGEAQDIALMDQTGPSLGISVMERLRNDILSARIKPGEKLRVTALAERYSCGASPVREALNQLSSMGLVTRRDRRGFYAREASREEFEDILSNRCFIESEALDRAIKTFDEAWQERVVLAHHRLAKISTGDLTSLGVESSWEAEHRAFHMSLISGCGSPLMIEICEQLYDLNIRYRYLATHHTSPRRANAVDEHDRLKAAVLSGAREQARALLVDHYRATGMHLHLAGDH